MSLELVAPKEHAKEFRLYQVVNEKSLKAIKEEVTLVRFMKEHTAQDNG